MASLPSSPNGTSRSGGVIPPDWPAQAADKIVETVDTVRVKTTRPALVAARAVVFGLAAGIIGVVAVVLLLIMAIRMLHNWVPVDDIWPIYAGFSVIFIVGGLYFLRKASSQPATPS